MMETPAEHIESLFANVGEYLENKTELWKLKIVDKTSETVSSIAEKAILFVFGLIFFILFNVGLALLIGYWLGHNFYGFFIMSAVYVIVGLVLHASREKWIRTPVTNKIIEKFIK